MITYIFYAVVPLILRGFFTFGFLMRWGQALLERRKNEKTVLKYLWWALSYVWIACMVVSAITDIIINVTLMTLLFMDKPEGWNETFSYRVGRYVHDPVYFDTWRQKIAMPICWLLQWLEGEDHCAYTYGAIDCPYPDLRILLNWTVSI